MAQPDLAPRRQLASGWANARLEAGDDRDYHADQTASAVAFLAAYCRAGYDADGLISALSGARESLDATLADDSLPAVCQNAWKDMTGRFTHTASTFLEAYAEGEAVARGTVEVVEPIGSDNYLYLDVAEDFIARVDSSIEPAVGERVPITFDQAEVHLFEPGSRRDVFADERERQPATA